MDVLTPIRKEVDWKFFQAREFLFYGRREMESIGR